MSKPIQENFGDAIIAAVKKGSHSQTWRIPGPCRTNCLVMWVMHNFKKS